MPAKLTVACFVAYFSPASSCTVSVPAVPVRSSCVLATSMLEPAAVAVVSVGANITSAIVGVPTPGSTCITALSDVSAERASPGATVKLKVTLGTWSPASMMRYLLKLQLVPDTGV